MLRAYRFRLYPTEAQKVLLGQHFGCCRFVYNRALSLKHETYRRDRTNLSQAAISAMLPGWKKEYPFLADVNAQSLQQTIKHLFDAYSQHFKHLADLPTYRSKHSPRQSFTVPQAYAFDVNRGTVKLPKIEAVKAVFHRQIVGVSRTLTVSRNSVGRYYISVLAKDDAELPCVSAPIRDQTVGIDLGLKQYATLSTGEIVDNPRYLKTSLQRLKVLQRRLSRKQRDRRTGTKPRSPWQNATGPLPINGATSCTSSLLDWYAKTKPSQWSRSVSPTWSKITRWPRPSRTPRGGCSSPFWNISADGPGKH